MSICVNFFAGPGVGKSTLCAGVFYKLKTLGRNVEMAMEYAKDLTFEQRINVLSADQLYVFAKQHRKINNLKRNNIDIILCESPLPLNAIYERRNKSYGNSIFSDTFESFVMDTFNYYNNVNYLIERNPNFYSNVGRTQSLKDAELIDKQLKDFLLEYNIPYMSIENKGEDTVNTIVNNL